MLVTAEEAAETLARRLREGRVVALVGAHASAAASRAEGEQYRGLPTPNEFAQSCAREFTYVADNSTFNVACDQILEVEGRGRLEQMLLTYYSVPEAFSPPPAHKLLAWLPFAFYITSNYDEFVERSLAREQRLPRRLVDNEDLVRLSRHETPVVKYHGCVTRPSTMVAATRDYDDLESKRALVRDFISANLAGKTLLVVGHGLGDRDLDATLRTLTDELQGYRPDIFVLRESGDRGYVPQTALQPKVVAEDQTAFLSRLLQSTRQYAVGSPALSLDDAWLSSAFFATLRQAASLPSETQVIDAFLAHLHDELAARTSVQDVLADAAAAVELTLHQRPNFEAVRRTWLQVERALDGVAEPSAAEGAVRAMRDERASRISAFKTLGESLIERNERVLLYSQSQRVIQVLLGVPRSVQRTVHLFVAECRPKSPQPYQDAMAVCRQLEDTDFKVTVCPDVVAENLLLSNQITRVLLGTHALFRREHDSEFFAFVNTCGSAPLTASAVASRVVVDVVGEELKIDVTEDSSVAASIAIHQEHDLIEAAESLKGASTRRAPIEHLNIGYDLVSVTDGVKIHVPDVRY